MPARDQPIQSYYPSARVRLIVRLEDYGDPGTPEPPAKPPQVRKGVKADKGPSLEVVEGDGGELVLLGPGDDPDSVGSPQQQTSSSDQRTFAIDGVVPVSATHMRNGIRMADTLTLQVQFRDLPIDPRVVRACGVEYFLGCVSPSDFERGISGELRSAGSSGVQLPYHVVPDEYVDRHGRKRSNLRFQGWVDEWASEWPEGDSPVVNLECTDNTRLLLEQDAPPRLTIGAEEPVDRAIAGYLANFPQFRGLSVLYQPRVPQSDVPVLKKVLARTAFQPKLGPSPSSGGSSKMTVWDYITDVAGSIGHTVRFEGTTIIVQRARTLYDARFSGRGDDPFAGRQLPSGRVLYNRLYLYGSNIVEMRFARKFTRYSPFNVEVRCYDVGRKKTLVARYPLKKDRQKRVSPGESADQKWIVFRVTGIFDEKVLRVVAQQIYEAVGRNELEARFTTKNLASFGGDNLDPDALDALPGDAVDVEVLRAQDEIDGNTVTSVAREMAAKPAEFLRQLGYDDAFARAYADAVSNISFPTTFRIRTVASDWRNDDGVQLDFECVNYLEVRADKQLPEGEEITPETGTGAPEPVRVVVEDD